MVELIFGATVADFRLTVVQILPGGEEQQGIPGHDGQSHDVNPVLPNYKCECESLTFSAPDIP